MSLDEQNVPAIQALYVITVVGSSITGILFLFNVFSVTQHYRAIDFRKASSRWRVSLLTSSFFAFCVNLLDGNLVWRNWTSNPSGCAAITIPHVLFYSFTKQALNLFLYDRAKIVHASLVMQGNKEKYLRWFRMLLWLTLVAGMPIAFYWSPFVAFTGVVYEQGNCVYYVLFPVVPILFAISDSFLAVGMLLIFLLPLWTHIKNMSEDGGATTPRITAVIHRNIIFSSIALSTGFLALVALATLEWIANADGTAATQPLRIWASFAIAFDNIISVLCIHRMTNGWLPSAIRQRLAGAASTTQQVTNNKVEAQTDDRVPSVSHNHGLKVAINPESAHS